MLRTVTLLTAIVGIVTALPAAQMAEKTMPITANDWTVLFDGSTLTGWHVRGGNAEIHVEAGAIVGTCVENTTTTFICPDNVYVDFELKFEAKIEHAELNSGVQIRSVVKGNPDNGTLTGPQVDIATGGSSGFIFAQGLGRWFQDPKSGTHPNVPPMVANEWISFRVLAVGPHIQTWVRDQPVADFTFTGNEEKLYRSGYIGLQVHGQKKNQGPGPHRVHFRNIQIRVISDK